MPTSLDTRSALLGKSAILPDQMSAGNNRDGYR